MSVRSTAPAGIDDPAPDATAIAAARDAAVASPIAGTARRDRVLDGGDVAAQKHAVGAEQRHRDVQRADPHGADDTADALRRHIEIVATVA